MAQYAVLIYAHDSAHAPDATPQDTEAERAFLAGQIATYSERR